jgi:hypothetical protein
MNAETEIFVYSERTVACPISGQDLSLLHIQKDMVLIARREDLAEEVIYHHAGVASTHPLLSQFNQPFVCPHCDLPHTFALAQAETVPMESLNRSHIIFEQSTVAMA